MSDIPAKIICVCLDHSSYFQLSIFIIALYLENRVYRRIFWRAVYTIQYYFILFSFRYTRSHSEANKSFDREFRCNKSLVLGTKTSNRMRRGVCAGSISYVM